MAQSPTAVPEKPKRRQQGPRTVKDKVVFMGYKGQFTDKPKFFLNSAEAMDALMADRELQVEKITLPKGKSRKPSGEGSQIATAAQAA